MSALRRHGGTGERLACLRQLAAAYLRARTLAIVRASAQSLDSVRSESRKLLRLPSPPGCQNADRSGFCSVATVCGERVRCVECLDSISRWPWPSVSPEWEERSVRTLRN